MSRFELPSQFPHIILPLSPKYCDLSTFALQIQGTKTNDVQQENKIETLYQDSMNPHFRHRDPAVRTASFLHIPTLSHNFQHGCGVAKTSRLTGQVRH
jgi:hypothetical protein